MKITILCPSSEFSSDLREDLSTLGEVQYTDSRREYELSELIDFCQGSQILGIDPDNLGGWEQVEDNLQQLVESLPKLTGLALGTTAFHYVNQDYCSQQGISTTYVPGYSSESVAEQSMAFLFGLMKRIFATQKLMAKNEYELLLGTELKGKTLGIVGLGNIGQKVATLANGLGMKVVAYNRTPKKIEGVEQMTIDQVVTAADALSLHIATNEETKKFLNEGLIAKIKPGMFMVNTADRTLVDEQALSQALKSGRVDSYAVEAAEKIGPLSELDNVFFFKGFGWHTKEALAKNKQIWVENIKALTRGKTVNSVPSS
jgi:phosphoglycerate dehydrogenase-like enzyme